MAELERPTRAELFEVFKNAKLVRIVERLFSTVAAQPTEAELLAIFTALLAEHVDDPDDAHQASAIGFTPGDGLLSNTVQDAVFEVKDYADALIEAQDAMVFKGLIDCSASPNYPAADRGHTYRVSVAGKIGGASGVVVEAGDFAVCLDDGTPAGNQATVGTHWGVFQANIDGAVTGPTSATSGNFATFSGASGKVIQDSGVAPADKQDTLVSGTNIKTINGSSILGAGNLVVGGGGGSGDVVGPASATDGNIALFDGTTGKLLKDGSFTASRILGRATAGAGAIEELTLSQLLDFVGSAANGDILIRSGGAWTRLAVGADGEVLTVASGLPSWAASVPTVASAFLTATQTNSTTTPAVLTGHTFTVPPGKMLQLSGQLIFQAAATTTGAALGVRVAQGGGADAHAIGSVAMTVNVQGSPATANLYDGDNFDVAAGANTLREVVGTGSSAATNIGSNFQMCVKNLSTNADTTVTIEFRSEVAASDVTAQIGTCCMGVLA
ncbi:MAG TPA: hypothetical protein VFM98_01815 [Ramlibacter sp.]|uniref:hypothetical protein n=1 Tax=Ramlibacter sp. TaxID=1917967 RepID=UPI002D7FB0E6|nr:hypothetical protein [Ramlibacter sp.]HET8744312.1 hypothetical protein [Ramlibacter sp.]